MRHILGLCIAAAAVVVLMFACGSSGNQSDAGVNDAGNDAGTTDTGVIPDGVGAEGGFGATCTINGDCEAAFICYAFGDGSKLCTKACTADTECPTGSQGQKCNKQGYCRP